MRKIRSCGGSWRMKWYDCDAVLRRCSSRRLERVPGKEKIEVRTLARPADAGDGAAVGQDDFPGDGQPEAGPVAGLAGQPVELFEDAPDAFRRDARALVAHAAADVAGVGRVGVERDATAGGRVLGR